ncbi:Bibenzyl synthase [Apostasia shenzhenica]|uniref:chalcone synthase n=1 Tax=Apostasia shenzhenica TaxID=1088818 RepID=A0A2I0AMM0_9ASPA|nr:Bibenzyl synthase [Apostasia shenzhenica]PKA56807.1 Bibenzyl synthase [Apostasia shenzhenica]
MPGVEAAAQNISPARSDGLAAILAIGRANPPNIVEQSSFADLYFRLHNSEHLVDLKKKLQRICNFFSPKSLLSIIYPKFQI